MENVRIAILDRRDTPLAFMDQDLPEALHYYSDELHAYLEGAAMTFGFKCPAKHPDARYLIEGGKLSFRYKDRDYYFNIIKVQRDEWEVEVESYGLMFELINEEVGAYKADKAMSFEEYLRVFDTAGVLKVGINEVSAKRIKNEWEGTQTLLARVFSLAKVFDAEVEFIPKLAKNYTLEELRMNVYREYDGENQGVGQRRTDVVMRYGREVEGIIKTADITELRTAIKPIGTDGLTIESLDKVEKDADGNVEYKSPAGSPYIYAVQACERFPSNLMEQTDKYITSVYEYDTSSINTLYGQALGKLKKLCVPQVKYEVTGYIDADIGDTIRISDDEFSPPLYLDARVTEQVKCFTDPLRSKTVLDNFVELQSGIDSALLRQMAELIQASKQYVCTISASGGTVFRNGEGETWLTPTIMDGGTDISNTMTYIWYKDGVQVSTDRKTGVRAAALTTKQSVYKVEARDAAGVLRSIGEVTLVSIYDGADGLPGPPGADGLTTYTWIKYADTPTSGMSDNPAGKTYMGIAFNRRSATESTNYADYDWCLIKGADGADGTNGRDGRGVRDITRYYLAYAENTGVTYDTAGWTTDMQVPNAARRYLWSYEKVTFTDGTDVKSSAHIIGTYSEPGKPGRTYILDCSDRVIKRGKGGALTPKTITLRSWYRDGDSASRVSYPARFKVEESSDGVSYATKYASTADQTSYTYTPTSSAKLIRCTLYALGGLTQELDSVGITVIEDAAGVTVGGRNLLRGTDVYYEITKDTTEISYTYWESVLSTQDLLPLLGHKVTLSIDVSSPGNHIKAPWCPDWAKDRRFGSHLTLFFKDSTGKKEVLPKYGGELLFLYGSQSSGRYSASWVLPTMPDGYDTCALTAAFQPFEKPAPDNPAMWRIGRPKLEIGNTPTDWTPAPEDLISGTTRYYIIQDTSLPKPQKPTAYPPLGWTTPEPEYIMDAKKSMYIVDHIEYIGGGWKYSDVSISRSYEMAKDTYLRAKAAEDELARRERLITSSTEPEDKGALWIDISQSPIVAKRYNQGQWQIVSDASDQINAMYTQLSDTIKETKEGILSQFTTSVYTKDDVDRKIAEFGTSWEQTSSGFFQRFKQIEQTITTLAGGTEEKFTEINKYISFVNGEILIGVEGDPISLKLANGRISFQENGAEVAYISNRTLFITDVEILHSLTLGRFALIPRANFNLSFKKVR